MPIQTDSLNRKLYDILDSRGYDPVPMDADVSKAGKTVSPEEADVFKFTFKRGDKPIDTALVSIDGANNLTLYYDEELSKEGSLKTADTDIDDSWFGFLKFLKKWAFSKRLSWELAPKHKIDSDMAQRTYMKKKEQIAEGYYPMGKQASYSDAIPTVKIVLQHTRQIQEGEQRYRNVARIFLENTHGERILAPTTKPGIAQIYARHLAEGGVPNDERWNHIKSLCEEYGKMAGFVRAVRGNQFNESAQRLVEAGLNHYQGLRESLGKMRGHRGYTAYFESWTPTLMETEGDESNLNELFVQETLDPRIESVMPILSKLKLNLGEMKEVDELAEWADSVTEDEGRQALNPVGIPESEEDVAEAAKWRDDDLEGKTWRSPDWDDGDLSPSKIKIDRSGKDVDDSGDELTSRPGAWRGKADMAKRMTKKGVPTKSELGFQDNLKMRMRMKKKEGGLTGPKGVLPEQGVAEETEQIDEVSMEKMLKYFDKGVKDLSDREIRINTGKAAADDAKKAQDRRKGLNRAARKIGDKIEESEIEDAEAAHKKINTPAAFRKAKGGDWKVTSHDLEKEKARTGTSPEGLAALKKEIGIDEEMDAEGDPKSHQAQTTLKHLKKVSYGDRADAANIKPGIAGYRDRIDMLQRAEKEGNLKEEDIVEGSGPKEKQKTPYRDINSPEYRAAADKQKQKMAKDKAAEPGKELADKIAKKGVAEGSESYLVYISKDRVEAFEDWMESEGLGTDVPKRDEGTYVVYDYSDANHTSKMYADEWNEKRGVAEEKSNDGPFEAYGVYGMQSKPWRKKFKNQAQFEAWLAKHEQDVEVHGFRDLEDNVAEDLGANQKRVGQLGPTGGPAKVGDLVGTNESMDPLKAILRLLGR